MKKIIVMEMTPEYAKANIGTDKPTDMQIIQYGKNYGNK